MPRRVDGNRRNQIRSIATIVAMLAALLALALLFAIISAPLW